MAIEIEMKEVKFNLEKIRLLSGGDKRRFVLVLLMLSDLNAVQKLLAFVQNSRDLDSIVYRCAQVNYSFFLIYILVGKLLEIRKFVKQENLFIDKNFSESPEIIDRWKTLGFIRNKLAFHYESDFKKKDEVERIMSSVLNEMKEFNVWFSPNNYANTFFNGVDETTINLIIKESQQRAQDGSKELDEKEKFEKILKCVLDLAGDYKNKLGDWLKTFIEKNIECINGGKVLLTVPKLSEARIPLIIG